MLEFMGIAKGISTEKCKALNIPSSKVQGLKQCAKFLRQETEREKTNNPKKRRKLSVTVKSEIGKIEYRHAIRDSTVKHLFFAKIDKIDKSSAKLIKKIREKDLQNLLIK